MKVWEPVHAETKILCYPGPWSRLLFPIPSILFSNVSFKDLKTQNDTMGNGNKKQLNLGNY